MIHYKKYVARGMGSSPVRFTGSGLGAAGAATGARGADDWTVFFVDDFSEPLRSAGRADA